MNAKKWVFPVAFVGKSQYRIALYCPEHSVPTSLGEIKKPCPRPLSGRGLVSNFFSSLAFLRGKIESRFSYNLKRSIVIPMFLSNCLQFTLCVPPCIHNFFHHILISTIGTHFEVVVHRFLILRNAWRGSAFFSRVRVCWLK